MRFCAGFLMMGIAAAQVTGGASPSRTITKGAQRVEIILERSGPNGWEAVDPHLVFSLDERVRFRFRTNFDGYLYVLNRASSGGYALLFPAEGAGSDNRVEADREYYVPRERGSYRITGAPGYDVLYWILSPIALNPSAGSTPAPAEPRPATPAAPVVPAKPKNLTPRCDDGIFRSRGDCVDMEAGPRAIQAETAVPRSWQVSMLQSRDLFFVREEKQAVVSAAKPLAEPVVYEYRIAHR